jgi:hypothetical protein
VPGIKRKLRWLLYLTVPAMVSLGAMAMTRASYLYFSDTSCFSDPNLDCSGGSEPLYSTLPDKKHYLEATARVFGGIPLQIRIQYSLNKGDFGVVEKEYVFWPFRGTQRTDRLGSIRLRSHWNGDSGRIRLEIPDIGSQCTFTMRKIR